MFVLLGLGGLAWAVQEPVWQSYLDYQATRPLSIEDQQALERCEDPGWAGLSRVLDQDLDTPCSEFWLVAATSRHLGDRERQWLRDELTESQRTVRHRLRVSTALWLDGGTPAPDWPFLVTDPRSGAMADYLEALRDGSLPPDLTDPLLRAHLGRAAYLEGDHGDAASVHRWLRLAASRRVLLPADERHRWAESLLALAGLPGDRLDELVGRHAAGLTVQHVPDHLIALAANGGSACQDRAEPDCLRFALDLVRAGETWDGGPPGDGHGPVVAPALLPIPLWSLLYDDPAAVRAAAEALGEIAAWVAAADPQEQAIRLLGSVAWPGHALDVGSVRAAWAGDPVDPIHARAATPWATALAALTLGEMAGVPVLVQATELGGVRLSAGAVEALVAPCNTPGPGVDATAPLWPQEAVMAQAALEAAGAALRAGEGLRALRLAAFAERLDPIGASGAFDAVRAVGGVEGSDARALGFAAGRLAGAAREEGSTEAHRARAARPSAWADLDAQWAAGGDPNLCPTVLGP